MKKRRTAKKPEISKELAYQIQIQAQERAAKRHKKDLKFLRDELDLSNQRLEVALDLDRKARRSRRVLVPGRRGRASESVAIAVASDWHSEERVYRERVNGKNEYTLPIAAKRIAAFFQKTLKLVEINRTATDIDVLLLPMLGDFMTGYIHEELMETNALSPGETLHWLLDQILPGLRLLRDKGDFKKIIPVCTVGNHGRTTQKRRVKTRTRNSYEWILYGILARTLTEGFEWHIADGYHEWAEVYGRRIRMHHGDAIRYQGGVGGITIPVNKAIAAWDKTETAWLDIFGHWHQLMFGQKFISNGSGIGYNEFSVEIKGDFEPPQQAFALVEKKLGRTMQGPIILEEQA